MAESAIISMYVFVRHVYIQTRAVLLLFTIVLINLLITYIMSFVFVNNNKITFFCIFIAVLDHIRSKNNTSRVRLFYFCR